jgi:hypothetical protein
MTATNSNSNSNSNFSNSDSDLHASLQARLDALEINRELNESIKEIDCLAIKSLEVDKVYAEDIFMTEEMSFMDIRNMEKTFLEEGHMHQFGAYYLKDEQLEKRMLCLGHSLNDYCVFNEEDSSMMWVKNEDLVGCIETMMFDYKRYASLESTSWDMKRVFEYAVEYLESDLRTARNAQQ